MGWPDRARESEALVRAGQARAEAQQARGRGGGLGQWQVDPRDKRRGHGRCGSAPVPPRWVGGVGGRAAAWLDQCRRDRGHRALELPSDAAHMEGGSHSQFKLGQHLHDVIDHLGGPSTSDGEHGGSEASHLHAAISAALCRDLCGGGIASGSLQCGHWWGSHGPGP